jgi:rare lipoprotein A
MMLRVLFSTANFRSKIAATTLVGAVLCVAALGFQTQAATPQGMAPQESQQAPPAPKAPLDRTGKQRVGKASFYANSFAGRKMADGKAMDPHDSNAASKTLPLGTIAKVTNLETGKSAVVTIEDRGPYVDGRIVDLSPATAQKIGLTRQEGVVKVAVAPIAVPLPGGGVKPGVAAGDAKLASNIRKDQRPIDQSHW